MNGKFHSVVTLTILITICIIFFGSICLINFSAVPSFFDADMYCDYRYAMEAWEYRSIFPKEWVFGNQLNAVSTPVLAAVLYELTENMNFSMAMACVIMAIMVVVSYDWMIKTAVKEKESRLMSIVLLISVVLYCGNTVYGNQGWTLLFTMCSYYSGYSITAFLAFGLYIRGLSGSEKYLVIFLIGVCVLSFATGIQSIRQTAIMILPMLAAEFFRMIFSYNRWRENKKPLLIVTAITASNVLGLCYVRMSEINQNQIFGEIKLTSFGALNQAVRDCIYMIFDLLGTDHQEAIVVLALLCLVCFVALIYILKTSRQERNIAIVAVSFLLGASVLVIAAIDVFTTMYVRPRYYFMLYPYISFLIACAYDHRNQKIRWCVLSFVVAFCSLACIRELPKACISAVNHREEACYEISTYLMENGYTTVYAEWGHGQDVAVASNAKIEVGYWYTEESPFEKVTHLCSLDIYNADPECCVYLFVGEDDAEIGERLAESIGVPLQLLRAFPESDTYLYTAESNLMQLFG